MPNINSTKVTILDLYKANVDIAKLKKAEKKIPSRISNSYLISYPEFIKYFAAVKSIMKSNVIIGIHFTYGWMPTIFDFRSEEFEKVIQILNNAKKGKIPDLFELEILKKCFNNSLVGVSKILHFINPNCFAIWDSRIYLYLTKKQPYNYRLDKNDHYLEYLIFCQLVTNAKGYSQIHKAMIKKVGYQMTPLRTLELILFLDR